VNPQSALNIRRTPIIKLAIVLMVALLLVSSCARQPQPSRIEKITFQSGSFQLVGDLRLPAGRSPFPLVILVHGSGLDDRTNGGFYLPLMERMAQAGYATFSWDTPGTGESTGEFSSTRRLHQKAQILLDAIEVIKARPDIDPQRIGLDGGSQAGYVMPLALSASNDIAFMICSACPGMSGADQTTYQAMALALCEGVPEEQIDRRTELLAELDAVRRYETYDEYVHYRQVIKALFAIAANAPKGYGFEVVPREAWLSNDPEIEDWWNPIDVIQHTTIPVLAIFGDRDPRIDPIQAAYAYREALEQVGNPKSRVELIPGANHDMIVSDTGCPDDDTRWLEEYVKSKGYASLSEAQEAVRKDPGLMSAFPFAPGFLDTIEEWLRDLR
jgi:pimeloyl-ACP methyl ester carboxylesterase